MPRAAHSQRHRHGGRTFCPAEPPEGEGLCKHAPRQDTEGGDSYHEAEPAGATPANIGPHITGMMSTEFEGTQATTRRDSGW